MRRIAVISDIHTNEVVSPLLTRCLNGIEADAVIFCGDASEHGRSGEFSAFYNEYRKALPNTPLISVPGNMDDAESGNGRARFLEAYNTAFNTERRELYTEYEDEELIVFGMVVERDDDYAPYTSEQLKALNKALERAAESKKPLIVFGHYALDGTISVSWPFAFLGPQSAEVRACFEKNIAKILYFNGHLHRGLMKESDGSAARRAEACYFSTPSLMMPDNEHYISDVTAAGTGYMLSIDAEKITVQGYDFLSQKPLDGFLWEV